MLDNPDKLILDKGGVIYMAEVSGKIVGVIALTIVSNEIYEIHKLGVAGNYHGQGIGLKLMNHCLDYCKNKGAKKVVLETNTKLEGAMRLYSKLGFTEIAMIDVKYEKSNYKMELIF